MKVLLALVAVGVVVAVIIGFTGQSQTNAERQFCRALASLNSSVQQLTSLSASSGATMSDFESDAEAVSNDWNNVKERASSVSQANMKTLDDAWTDFSHSLQSVPGTESVSTAEQDVASGAQSMQSAVKSTQEAYDCSS